MQNKNEIANNLFEAIDIIVDKKLSSLTFNRTIVGEIIEPADGGYRVRHQDSTFIAYPADRGVSYQSGAAVYVLLPNNSFNNTKIILSSVAKQFNDVSKISEPIGNLADLETTDKSSIVNAINELQEQLGDSLAILDETIGAGE